MTKCQTVTICIITQNYNTPNFILNTKKRQQVKNTMQSRDCSRLIMVCLAVLHNLQLLSLLRRSLILYSTLALLWDMAWLNGTNFNDIDEQLLIAASV